MTTAEHQPREQHQQQSLGQATQALGTTYDSDDCIAGNSPPMKVLRPRIQPSPTPPLDIPATQVSLSSFPIDGRSRSNRSKIHPISGDAVLVNYMANGCQPHITHEASLQALPGADDDAIDGDSDDDDEDDEDDEKPFSDRAHDDASCPDDLIGDSAPAPPATMTLTNLQHVAADALQVFGREPTPTARSPNDISTSTRQLSIHDNKHIPPTSPHPYPPPHDTLPPFSELKPEGRSPVSILSSPNGGLPPLQMDSPRSDGNGQSLPSIRSTLGNFRLMTEPPAHPDKDASPRGIYPRSPPNVMPRLYPMSGHHGSPPPVSPNDSYPRNLPSPRGHAVAGSPYYHPANNYHHRPSIEYSSSATVETPSTDQSGSTPATSTSVADRMSIDGLTNPQVGVYICSFAGCNAPPFQTQYLLNSHANVHSSARPHYCPVKGCPRSEGGKGFKRKNEMIRHGLVHDSPGYVCPFCPDREHKYPRPDNLQRHVRVHHVDKNKDDPLLRDVLAQRPDGPNRGRRRRGPSTV
jgi:hypothetical protein